LINKPGGGFKTGLIIASCRVVLEGAKYVIEAEAVAKEAQATRETDELNKLECEALKAHRGWVSEGRPVDGYGHPRLSWKDAHAIVKFLLPRINLKGEKKMNDFGTMKACMQWLWKIARRMTWDEHMAAAADETYAKWELTLD
jgi:hypothetical protein